MATLTLLPIMVFAALSGFAADPAAKKCGQPPGVHPLVAVDGEFVQARISDLDHEEILFVDIVCLDPADSTVTRKQTGIAVVSTWTVDGPVPDLLPALEAVHTAQSAHFETTGTYLDSLDYIDLSEFHADLSLTLRVERGGWVALAAVERLPVECAVFDGELAEPPVLAEPGEPRCLRDGRFRVDW